MMDRFAFGENWRDYASKIELHHVEEAQRGMRAMLGTSDLSRKSFVDIGCGSGIHSVAALRMGAIVTAIDYDPISVETTRGMINRFAPGASANTAVCDILNADVTALGTYDIVYSWGVLHHTGDMKRALSKACSLVAPGGLLAISIYKKSWLCWAWSLEKKWYSTRASEAARARARNLYIAAWRLNCKLKHIDFDGYVSDYRSARGMDFDTDVADWLGGWPYESATMAEVRMLIERQGLMLVRSNVSRSLLGGRPLGVFGTRCDEFVFEKSETTLDEKSGAREAAKR